MHRPCEKLAGTFKIRTLRGASDTIESRQTENKTTATATATAAGTKNNSQPASALPEYVWLSHGYAGTTTVETSAA
jgi:hypothetical protein